ncbi:hypothetical protein D3C87_1112840 [compost metagenome]
MGVNQPMRMPPRISTGAARPQEASRRLFQKGGRGRCDSSAPILYLRDSQTAGTIRAKPARMPGIMPAANSAGTEAPGTSTE